MSDGAPEEEQEPAKEAEKAADPPVVEKPVDPPIVEKPAEKPATPIATGTRPARIVASFAVAGWLLGVFESALAGSTKSRALVFLFAAVLASALTVPLGVLGAIPGFVLRLRPRGRAWLDRRGARPTDMERTSIFRAHSFAAAALLLSAVAIVASGPIFDKLFDLQEEELAKSFAVVLAGGIVGVVILGASFLSRAGARGLTALERRLGKPLPLPVPAWLAFFAIATVPLLALAYPFLRKYGAMIGLARDASIVLVAVVLGVQLSLLSRVLSDRAGRIASRSVAGLAVGLLVLVGVLGGKKAGEIAAAERSMTASFGGRAARFLTDVDRDGVSNLYGGGDCAPFNPKRAPNKTEIPGNGIDEDCNGSDSATLRGALGNQRLFSDAVSGAQVKRYNLVWVIYETTRADHVSAISYSRPTTPYLEKLGKESLVFTRAYANASGTVISIPSMLSGIDPGVAMYKRANNHPQLAEEEITLAERLKQNGYKTGLVLDNYIQENFKGMHQGFGNLLLAEPDTNRGKYNRPRRNLISTAKAAEFLAKIKPDDSFFLVVYYPDAHSPYTRHEDVDSSQFETDELGDYDTELAWGDQQLRALVEMLKARPKLWDDTIVVVTADHGEEFHEHGGDRHAQTCYDEVLHVPLVVRIPGIASARIDTRVALIDVVPTFLEMTGMRDDLDRLGGQSLLLPALRSELVDADRPIFCTIPSITPKYGTFFRRSVRTSKFTLIHDIDEGFFSLFDYENDPGEKHDVSSNAEFSGQLESLKAILEASHTGNLNDHTKLK